MKVYPVSAEDRAEIEHMLWAAGFSPEQVTSTADLSRYWQDPVLYAAAIIAVWHQIGPSAV